MVVGCCDMVLALTFEVLVMVPRFYKIRGDRRNIEPGNTGWTKDGSLGPLKAIAGGKAGRISEWPAVSFRAWGSTWTRFIFR